MEDGADPCCRHDSAYVSVMTSRFSDVKGICLRRCSGDDAVNICGKAAPVLRGCSVRARKCGVRAYERAAASLTDCKIEACGEQGVKTFEGAALSLIRQAPSSENFLATSHFYKVCVLV